MNAAPSAMAVPAPPTRSPLLWWGALAACLSVHLLFGWIPAFALAGMFILQVFQPLAFLPAYLLVVAGASFVDYTRGTLTAELSLLSVGILYMLFCYLLSRGSRAITVPSSPLTLPLLLFLASTTVQFVRGIVTGNSMRYAGLELLPVLALATAFMIGNGRFDARRMQLALWGLFVVGLANSALGLAFLALVRRRVGSIFFTPVPGLISLVFLNFALREPDWRRRLAYVVAMTPLLLHQFMSFTRGYWFGLIGAWAFSIALYLWTVRGERSLGVRRVAGVVGTLLALGLVGVTVLSQVMGITELLTLAAERFGTSTSTELTYATGSNVIRLVEYLRVMEDVVQSPWIGHGLGHYFVVREPFTLELQEQWATHQTYLLVWLKQGLVGLGIFLWLLFVVVRTSWNAARTNDVAASSWAAGAGAATVFAAIHGLVYFTFAEVYAAFPLALLWGGLIAVTARGRWSVVWKRPVPSDAAGRP